MIVAVDRNFGIGNDNKLPWSFSKDMEHFKTKTTKNKNNAVVMGRKTYESIGARLPNRTNYVLSKNLTKSDFNDKNIILLNNPEQVFDLINYDEVWIIGGSSIYDYFLTNYPNKINQICLTKVHENYECDVFFPKIPNIFYKTVEKIFVDFDRNKNNSKKLLSLQSYKS